MQLPRLYLTWHSPAIYQPGDAELDTLAGILTGGKNSRLYKRLVYDMQIAQSVSAGQDSNQLGSTFQIVVTARPSSDPPDKVLERLKGIIDEELNKLRETPPTDREMQRMLNTTEASFYNRMERVGGFGGKADQLNGYWCRPGTRTTSTRISRGTGRFSPTTFRPRSAGGCRPIADSSCPSFRREVRNDERRGRFGARRRSSRRKRPSGRPRRKPRGVGGGAPTRPRGWGPAGHFY